MSVSRRKWSSVERLDVDSIERLGADLHNPPSNLRSLRSLSVSTPSLKTPVQFEEEEEEGDGGTYYRKGNYTSDSSGDEDERDFNLHTPLVPTKSIGRQKKFARHFKKEDLVIDYYACALAVDILLQGFLYITENHFAFYSNVFGRVSKILIPVCTITKITKNKTALIFPNAIRVYTLTEKHVFASLISRDTTYALMHKVWSLWLSKSHKALRKSLSKTKGKHGTELRVQISEKHGNGKIVETFSESDNYYSEILPPNFNNSNTSHKSLLVQHLNYSTKAGQVKPTLQISPPDEYVDKPVQVEHVNLSPKNIPSVDTAVTGQGGRFSWKISSQKLDKIVIFLSVISIIVLVISAINLYMRIDQVMKEIQQQMSLHEKKNLDLNDNEQLLNWQKLVHGNSANDIVHHIDENIEKIHKASASLEACYIDVTRKIKVQNSDGEIRVDYMSES